MWITVVSYRPARSVEHVEPRTTRPKRCSGHRERLGECVMNTGSHPYPSLKAPANAPRHSDGGHFVAYG